MARGRVVIRNVAEAPCGEFPELVGASERGKVRTRPLISDADRPAKCWIHELSPGAEVVWHKPVVDHVAYVWSGGVVVGAESLSAGGAVVIEHGSDCAVNAGPSGAVLVHCHRAEAHSEETPRSGGRYHVVGPEGLFKSATPMHGHVGTYFADSDCDTCELWLHESRFSKPGYQVARHFHTVDEIMFIVHGEMKLGRRSLGSGTALAIDADTTYTFSVGNPGLAFINFRPSHPFVVFFRPEGRQPPKSELEIAVGNRIRENPARPAA